MQALLCIDDTDNLDSIGTGEMLQNLSQLLDQKNLAQAGFVTRHQLFLHEDIAYTSHNSAMCTGLLLRQEDLAEILSVAGRFLQEEAAEGSDPGLCLLCYEALTDRAELIAFGRRAKQEVLQKQDAYQLAAKYPGIVFLSEHGGTGDGVIGALAGCGLRLSGSDGKIKGKIQPKQPGAVMKIKDFLAMYQLAAAYDKEFQRISEEEEMVCGTDIKACLKDDQPIVILKPDETGKAKWHSMDIKEIKQYGIGV